MEDVRKLAIKTLRSTFKKEGIKIFSSEASFTEKDPPDEYIVVYLISSVYTAYANGKPIRQRDSIDVDYYGKNQDQKVLREPQILKALETVDFRTAERFSDDGSGSDERGFFYSFANLSIERVILDG